MFRIRFDKELLLYLQMLFYIESALHEMDYGVLCPYSNLCQTKSQSVRPAGDPRWPCCVQCSCADTCHMTNRCCPDKVWRMSNGTEYAPTDNPVQHTNSIVSPECIKQKDLYNRYLGTQSTLNGNDFNVIHTCPETLESETMTDAAYKCSHGNRSLNNVQFVSDVNNEFLYFNKYCAQCNGVYDVIDWSLKATCRDSIDISSAKMMSERERDNFTISTCSITSVPPSVVVGFHFLCDTYTIKTCNVTGEWNFFDAELKRNCLEQKGSLFDGGALGTFANVYCFLCNSNRWMSTYKLCNNPFFKNASRSILYPFTFFIKPNLYKSELVPKNGAICEPNEIWDYLMLKCRQLFCPYGTIPKNGNCKALVDKLNGVTFYVYHKINLTLDMFQHLQVDYAPWINMIRSLTGAQHLEKEGCILCSIYTAVSPSGNILSRTIFTTTETCSVETLLTLLQRAARGGAFLFSWETYDIKLDVELLYNDSLLVESRSAFLKQKYLNCRHGSTFTFDLVHCPGLRYEYDELMTSNNADITKYVMIAKSTMVSKSTYMICYKQYKEVLELVASASQCYANTMLMFLINCIVVSVNGYYI